MMMTETMSDKHRRRKIVEELTKLLSMLKRDTDESGLPFKTTVLQRRFLRWSALDSQGALPALQLNFGDYWTRREGPTTYAPVGYMEEVFPFTLYAVLKEGTEESENREDILYQVSDLIFSLDKLINGCRDLGIDGVVDVRMPSSRAGEAVLQMQANSPFEVFRFRIEVWHVYPATTSV